MTDLMAPLCATAHRCGLRWAEPFILYQADKLSPSLIDAAARRYTEYLAHWIGNSPVLRSEPARSP